MANRDSQDRKSVKMGVGEIIDILLLTAVFGGKGFEGRKEAAERLADRKVETPEEAADLCRVLSNHIREEASLLFAEVMMLEPYIREFDRLHSRHAKNKAFEAVRKTIESKFGTVSVQMRLAEPHVTEHLFQPATA